MNRGEISNTLRRLRLLRPLDGLRYELQKLRNRSKNRVFKSAHPSFALPPDYLIYESFQIDYKKYYESGIYSANRVLSLLREHINLSGAKILDWGCGPGRVIRHLAELNKKEMKFYGTDYNQDSIAWCKKNIPEVRFNHNNLEAHLPYSSAHFDAIYGLSIFTHLSRDKHFQWIDELKRILRKEGVLLVTTQGENFRSKLSKAEVKKFDEGELIVRGNVEEGHRTYSAFHPCAFLNSMFDGFEVLEKIVIKPENACYTPQDTWVLRKK